MASSLDRFFTEGEYSRRIAAIRAAMCREAVDLLITAEPANVCYSTGHHSVNQWDPVFLILPLDRTPVLLVPEAELGRFEASCTGAEAAPWARGADPAAALLAAGSRCGAGAGRVAVDIGGARLPAGALLRAIEHFGAERKEGIIESVRLVKSDAELECIRQAARLTDLAMAAALAAVREGARDHEVAASAASACWRAGGERFCMDPIVAVGERAAVAHSSHAGALIEAGQPVFIELSGVRASYTAPLMRTAIVGDPPADVEELASRSIAAIDAVVGAAGHGVPACDVAQAGLRALGPVLSRVRFHHLFGYPVGLGVPPSWLEESGFWLTATNPRPLQAGMVFHLPMTLRIPGRLGVGFSETLIITATGAEIGGSTARALHRG